MNKNIFFRFDADDGTRHGLGHFYRTKKIIDYIIKKNIYLHLMELLSVKLQQ